MQSSWSIHDIPPEDGEDSAHVPVPEYRVKLTSADKSARVWAVLKKKRNRHGKGFLRRAGQLGWATRRRNYELSG